MERTFLFRRSGSLAPGAAWLALGSLSAIALGVGLLFAARGAWVILMFSAAEVGALLLAFSAARLKATDFDLLRVSDDDVLLTRQRSGRQRTFRCARCWARVAMHPADAGGPASLELRLRGDAVQFGANLGRAQCTRLARELNGLFATPRIPFAPPRVEAGLNAIATPTEADP